MTQATIESMSPDAFDEAVEKYISWASEWDGSLPADTFFGVWADLQRETGPFSLKARMIQGRLELSAPPDSMIRTTDNHIYLENGLELVIDLEPAS